MLRLEEKKDRFEAENLTREAFWNVYKPGCDEHFVLHNARGRKDFVQELDCVIQEDGHLVAHIMYCTTAVRLDEGGEKEVLTFGPVSVLPELQKQGYGSKIIRFTLEKATELGYGAVAITGSPDYYHRFGFEDASSFGVYYEGMAREEDAPYFMIKELKKGYFDGCTGVYAEPACYKVDAAALEIYDKQFSPKTKEIREGQLFA